MCSFSALVSWSLLHPIRTLIFQIILRRQLNLNGKLNNLNWLEWKFWVLRIVILQTSDKVR